MLWYLNRFVSPEEWNALANIPDCCPQRNDDGNGTYVFAPAESDYHMLESLGRSAPGEWRKVA